MCEPKNYLFISIFVFCWMGMYGQKYNTDSILHSFENMPNDTTKVSELLKLSGEYRMINASKGVEFAFRALELSKNIKHNRSIIKSYYMVSAGYITGGIIDSCIYYGQQAELIAEKDQEMALLGNIYNLLGAAFRSISDHKNAIEYGFKSAKLLEELKDSTGLSYTYNNLGNLYWDKRDTINAKKFFERALVFFEQSKDSLHLPSLYSNLYLVSGESKKIDYLFTAESIAIKTGNFSSLSYIYTNLGSYYFEETPEIEKAKSYYLLGLEHANNVEDLNSQSQLLSNLGDLYGRAGNKDSSIYYLKNALKISTMINDYREIQDEYFTLYQLYKSLGNADSSLLYLELFTNIKDSLHTDNIIEELQRANALYETEKKEAEIARQKLSIEKEKKRRYVILFGSIVVILVMGLVYLWYVNLQKRKNKETELALQLKKKESEKLKELNQMKSRFFANITHELRTPLTLIIGPIHDVISKIKEKKHNESLKIAHSNARKLLKLVNEILDLSSFEEGKPEINNSMVPFYTLMHRIFNSYQSLANIKQFNYKLEVSNNEEVSVLIDQEKLEKIIDNLLSNAFKYTKEGGSIVLRADHHDQGISIEVEDSGIGIASKDQKHVFDRYFQGENTENITGTGIGLSFAKQLTKLMGGRIELESEVNKGSKFTVFLPSKTEKVRQAEKEVELVEAESNKSTIKYTVKTSFDSKPRVLIVEDNTEMTSYLQNILEDHFEIETAINGFEGLSKLKEKKFDLVSSDVMMPGMDGFVFRKEMNKNPEWKNIPFVLLTARSLKEDKLKGLQLGVDDYINKPFSADEYLARIYNLIQNKFAREEMMKDKGNILDETVDDELVRSIEKLVIQNIDDPDFNVNALSSELGYSQRNLARICKKLTGITPVNLILEIRLQRAYQLLRSSKFKTIAEVRYEVGMGNASYFSKKFRERFGINPNEIGQVL